MRHENTEYSKDQDSENPGVCVANGIFAEFCASYRALSAHCKDQGGDDDRQEEYGV